MLHECCMYVFCMLRAYRGYVVCNAMCMTGVCCACVYVRGVSLYVSCARMVRCVYVAGLLCCVYVAHICCLSVVCMLSACTVRVAFRLCVRCKPVVRILFACCVYVLYVGWMLSVCFVYVVRLRYACDVRTLSECMLCTFSVFYVCVTLMF